MSAKHLAILVSVRGIEKREARKRLALLDPSLWCHVCASREGLDRDRIRPVRLILAGCCRHGATISYQFDVPHR